MPKICYVPKNFHDKTMDQIIIANEIIDEYNQQGFDLTLRQLYYQMVSRGYIPNRQSEYKKLGSTINDARLAGLIDWHAIVDRTRNVRRNSHFNDPSSVLRAAHSSYKTDMWENQEYRLEVWIEKDALVGVIDNVCRTLDVPYFSCRGYTSQSEMWSAAQRLLTYIKEGQTPIILHLGDHDPSGIDMTRDIAERLEMFTYSYIEVERLALNWNQVQQYNPPPNPAKLTDSRASAYVANYGFSSWELDALEPTLLERIIENSILSFRDDDQWDEDQKNLEKEKELLKSISENVASISTFLDQTRA